MNYLTENWRLLLSVGKMILAPVVAAGIFTYSLKRRVYFGGRLVLTLAVHSF